MHRAHRTPNLEPRRHFSPPITGPPGQTTTSPQGTTPWATGPASPYLAGPVRALDTATQGDHRPEYPQGLRSSFPGTKTTTHRDRPGEPVPLAQGDRLPGPATGPRSRLRGSWPRHRRPPASFPPRSPVDLVSLVGNRAQEPTWGAGSWRPGRATPPAIVATARRKGEPQGGGGPCPT